MQQLSTNLAKDTSNKLHDIEVAFSNIDFSGALATSFVKEIVGRVYANLSTALEDKLPTSIARRMHFLAGMMKQVL